METTAEHVARVGQDLADMFADFSAHSLPRPLVFAYPFSDADTSYDGAAVAATAELIDEDFVVALTNKTGSPAPASHRSAANQLVERLEVFATTDANELLSQVIARTGIPPRAAHPLADASRWWDDHVRGVAQLDVFLGRGDSETGDSQTEPSYRSAAYAPYASADWIDYVVSTTVRGLRREGNNANLIVRSGSPTEVAVRTSCCSVQVVDVATGALLAQRRLTLSDTHRVRVEVASDRLTVTVDAAEPLLLPMASGARNTGGIAIASRRGNSGVWPYFAEMSIMELDGSLLEPA
jgi:hypothetical protein